VVDTVQSKAFLGGLLALILGAAACEGDPPPPAPSTGPLVELEAWERVENVSEDVFGEERPDGLVCDPVLGIGTEFFGADEVLELSTDYCNYATVRQPSLRGVAAGETVAVRIWHYELTHPAPAEAHLALAIDGEALWEERIPTPAAAAFVDGEIAIDRALPAGTELQLHVHNHGANSYALVSLEVVPGEAPP
jgi:hypothetical protein